jgi:ATP-dependent RNA helicase DHX29
MLQGVAEIDMLIDRLSASVRFGGASSDWILPLHSLLGPSDQRKVFQSPPDNFRKVITPTPVLTDILCTYYMMLQVIVATDIAETSITIDDVIYVVDTGKHKQNRFNPRKVRFLLFSPVNMEKVEDYLL